MRLPKLFRKDNPAYRSIFATFGGSKGPVWKTVDYENYIREGYQRCAAVFACVSMTAKSASRISWTLKQGKRELESHELLTRLARPNEYESGVRFGEKVVSYLRLSGNSYIYRNSGIPSAPPAQLYSMRPDRMTVVQSGNWKDPISGYEYSAGAKPETLDKRLVLHITEFAPLDDWYGLSLVEVAARQIDTSNQSDIWNMKRIQNDLKAPGLLIGKSIFDIEELKKMFRENYLGPENAGMPLFFGGEDLKWEKLSESAKDLDWLEGQKRVLRAICSVFGVPSQLLGDTEATTYANYQEARAAFYMETVLPIMDLYRDELNSWLVPLYGDNLKLDYDRDSIEALNETRLRKYASLEGARFLKINEKRVAAGYGETPEGDVILVGMGEMSLADAVAPAGDLSTTPDKSFRPLARKSLDGFWRGANERKALWQNYERRVVSKERAFQREVAAYLAAQGKAVAVRAAQGVTAPESLLDRGDAEKSYKDKFTKRYTSLYASALAAGRAMTEGKLYEFEGEDKADVTGLSPEVRKRLEKLIEDSAKVITDETLSEIQAVMRDSLGTMLTTQEIANALSDKLVGQMSPMRARRIARTETAMLENSGNLDGFKENEFVSTKIWLCSFVSTSRDEHEAADGQEVGINEPFTLDGPDGPKQLDYPGDRSNLGGGKGSGYYVINCLCAVAPAMG